MSQSRQGSLIQADFFDNVGGLNLSDSPFKVLETQSTGGLNLDYSLTGGLQKRLGHELINSAANAQLRSLGLGLWNSVAGVKAVIRAGGLKLQSVDVSAPSFTDLTEDTTAAASSLFSNTSTQPVVFNQFNSALSSVLWSTGGGQAGVAGVYSTAKYTNNGVAAPTGTISKVVNSSAGGTFVSTGTYYYGVAFRKASTQAVSNVALDISATVAATTDAVVITLSSISNIDTTLYDKVVLYRSAVGGATSFTTGDIVANITSGTTSYTDTGTYLSTSQNVPRAGNTLKDNSVLPTAIYNCSSVFKRRLITCSGSTVYLSDLNLSESWPTTNVITVPSGGPITALATISFTSPQAQTLDELLVIFKEREVWVITGTSYSDWALKFIDVTGCPVQSLICQGNGYICWVDYRGVYMWDGSGKPTYLSRPLEPLFGRNGDLDKTKLNIGTCQFSRKSNQVVWFLSHKTYGEQKYAIKLDLRLTLPSVNQALTGRIMDGVFSQDNFTIANYASMYYLPSGGADEQLLAGDGSGYVYRAYNAYADSGAAYSFTYATKFLDLGTPGTRKRIHKVVVWVEEIGAWPLTLDYWIDYRSATSERASVAELISGSNSNSTGLWDLGYWDTAYWDDFSVKFKPITFNLNAGTMNSNEGTCLRLQFRNDGASQPVTIAGFSVIYSIQGLAN